MPDMKTITLNGVTYTLVDAEARATMPKAFYVAISGSNGAYTADKTVTEILTAYEAGRPIFCQLSFSANDVTITNLMMCPLEISGVGIFFGGVTDNLNVGVYYGSDGINIVTSTFAKKGDIPSKLPNPKKITFTGGATGSYDGSTELTINVPTVNDIINAIPVWEGGDY